MNRNTTKLATPHTLLTVTALLVLAATVIADVPTTMTYQGRATDGTGNPVTDGPHDFTFRIYDETSMALWSESHTITTDNGFFSVELGSNGSPLTADLFDHEERWLGITVGTDPEITPRTRLNTVPYSFRTGSVHSDDIVNGPGVAAYVGPSYPIYLDDSAYTAVCSLAIDCPSAGYVMAVAHGRIATMPQHTTGTISHAFLGISNVSTALPGNQDLDFQISEAAPTGVYSVPYGLTSMFTVESAGTDTYYCVVWVDSGSEISIADMQFSLLYVPTAYGTVDPVPPPQYLSDSDLTPNDLMSVDGVSDPAAQRPVDIRQLRRELEQMKARIEFLEGRLEASSE